MKYQKVFLAIVLLLTVFESGCVLAPTWNYCHIQCSDNPSHIRESNEWPCGNITNMTTCLLQDALYGPDDYVLPPALDRFLNVTCIIPAYPVSLVFDVVTFPYQWWRYCHQPPLPENQ